MAVITENDKITITADGADDVQLVTITREQARAYFDGSGLPEEAESALDLAQAEAETGTAVLVLVIRP